ncbi:unnamed protein product [Amoebophrya sp. A120]|nr:unnamed protein product [Amoebophrya sp. A120]|eukprot:GSA120T00004524001.1
MIMRNYWHCVELPPPLQEFELPAAPERTATRRSQCSTSFFPRFLTTSFSQETRQKCNGSIVDYRSTAVALPSKQERRLLFFDDVLPRERETRWSWSWSARRPTRDLIAPPEVRSKTQTTPEGARCAIEAAVPGGRPRKIKIRATDLHVKLSGSSGATSAKGTIKTVAGGLALALPWVRLKYSNGGSMLFSSADRGGGPGDGGSGDPPENLHAGGDLSPPPGSTTKAAKNTGRSRSSSTSSSPRKRRSDGAKKTKKKSKKPGQKPLTRFEQVKKYYGYYNQVLICCTVSSLFQVVTADPLVAGFDLLAETALSTMLQQEIFESRPYLLGNVGIAVFAVRFFLTFELEYEPAFQMKDVLVNLFPSLGSLLPQAGGRVLFFLHPGLFLALAVLGKYLEHKINEEWSRGLAANAASPAGDKDQAAKGVSNSSKNDGEKNKPKPAPDEPGTEPAADTAVEAEEEDHGDDAQ